MAEGNKGMNLIIRETISGEPSLVAHFYFKLFEKQFAFLPITEQYFMNAAAEVYDHPENRIWIAVDGDEILGSICIVRKGDGEAQLRLFGTDPSLQGKGIGKRLMQTAMNYCKEHGYKHIILWTIDICKSALHIYDAFGFRHTEDKPNDIWANYHMTEELWEYEKA